MGYALTQFIVTGASGYLGGQILSMLREKNIPALGVGRSKSCDLICDLRDRNATQALITKFPSHRVIHCAAAVPKSKSDYFDEEAAEESLEMVRNLVNAHPCRMILTSSMVVYPEGTTLAREEDAASNGDGYAAKKLEAERVLLESPDISSTTLRFPGLFGLPRRGGVLFNSALALAHGEKPVLDPILPQWAAMHVEDAAEICIRAASMTPGRSIVMNVGYPERMAISDAINQLAILFGVKLTLPAPKWFAFDLSRLHESLGPVSGKFQDRLHDLANWARNNVRNGKYD